MTHQCPAAPNVKVISQDFWMPQLHRPRRIWLYLPPDYPTSGRDYPVIYMHDGQNLFDDGASFSGAWHVDKTLNRLHAKNDYGAIIVGIDNGGEHRLAEYSPWARARMGGGEGSQYADFVALTLKPYIDHHYRTLPQREHTCTWGSSMGGLIAFYLGLKYTEVFGKIAVFSPAFWFNSPKIYDWAAQQPHRWPTQVYLMGSRTESIYMERHLRQAETVLRRNGFTDQELTVQVRARGGHNEKFWGKEFVPAYKKLFGGPAPKDLLKQQWYMDEAA
jgi:predicted alpha/beta superfamily hydrolase